MLTNHDHIHAAHGSSALVGNGNGHWQFMPERTVCDAEGCEQDTPLATVGSGKFWLTLDRRPGADFDFSHDFGVPRFAHFCSWACLASFAGSLARLLP